MPGTLNLTLPGLCAVDIAGVPPGNTQEYLEALVLVPKLTALPAVIVTLPDGALITPLGGTRE